MGEVVKVEKIKLWYSDLWVIAFILMFPISGILEFWLPRSIASPISYLLFFNIALLSFSQETWINSKIKNRFARFIVLNLLFGTFSFLSYWLATYLAEFITVPPSIKFSIPIIGFFLFSILLLVWIVKSTKK